LLKVEVNLEKYDNTGLVALIHQSEKNPPAYTKLLIDQIFPTLEKISNKLSSDSVVHNLNSSATHLISQIYNNQPDNNCDCILTFYRHLRDIIKVILLDRMTDQDIKSNKNKVYLINTLSESINDDEYSIVDVDEALTSLKLIEPDAYEALSYKLYTASSNLHIASLMNQSLENIERYINEGSKILITLMYKPSVVNGLSN
jgi:hypothetical protein